MNKIKLKEFAKKLLETIKKKDLNAFLELHINKQQYKQTQKLIKGEKFYRKSSYKNSLKETKNSFSDIIKEIEILKINLNELTLNGNKIFSYKSEKFKNLSLHSVDIEIKTEKYILEISLSEATVLNGNIFNICYATIKVLSSKELKNYYSSENIDKNFQKSLIRYRNAEKHHSKRERDIDYQYHLKEIRDGNYDKDEEFDEDEYIINDDNSYVSLELKEKASKGDVENIENKLNISFPLALKQFYLNISNGVGEGEQFEILPLCNIQGLVDFFQGQINEVSGYDIYSGDDFGNKLSSKETQYLKDLNKSHFVFAVSWNDYQFLDLLIFDKEYNFYGLCYSGEEEQYIFTEYLKSFKKDNRTHTNVNYLFSKFIDCLIMDMGDDDNGEKFKTKLFFNNKE